LPVPVTSVCDFYLNGRREDTRVVGKTTGYLSAGWIGGGELGWFDDTRGGGPTTGVGVYRDWGKSTIRMTKDGNGCVLDTTDAGSQWRLQGGWSSALWSPYKRLEAGGAYVDRVSADLSIAFGVDLLAQGTGTSQWAIGAAPDVRVTYDDWVGLRAAAAFDFAGKGDLKHFSPPEWIFEAFISKRFEMDHFP
jgi:hypothetical protein